ncbi:MAG: hypothetical protein ACI4GA_01850 [Acutalibacteraceae bacterium]|nr:hypothetical protein [Oscillospiraceae bacterium]
MNKHFKKLISVLLCLAMLTSFLSLTVGAISADEGLSALRAQWSKGYGPNKGGYSIDYSYFSPKKGNADTTKYPLCIFLAGAGEGKYDGKELTANSFPYWSADEYQAKFQNAGGAYLMLARAPEPVYWDTAPASSLKAAIDDFIEKNPNVDSERIYILGWCLGAVGAANIASKYPGFFAGAILMCMRHAITESEAENLKDTAVWLVHCKNDSYSLYNTYCVPSWRNLREHTSDLNKLRLTTCSSAPTAAALLNHNVWDYIVYDCSKPAGCSDLNTVDGKGQTQNNVSAINWLSQWTNEKEEEESSCSCDCHSGNSFVRFIWQIKVFFYKIFSVSSKRVCACGAKHW